MRVNVVWTIRPGAMPPFLDTIRLLTAVKQNEDKWRLNSEAPESSQIQNILFPWLQMESNYQKNTSGTCSAVSRTTQDQSSY